MNSYPIDIPFGNVGYFRGHVHPVFSTSARVFDSSEKWGKLWNSIRDRAPYYSELQTPPIDFSTRKVILIPVSTRSSADDYRISKVRKMAPEKLLLYIDNILTGRRGFAVMGKMTLAISVIQSLNFKVVNREFKRVPEISIAPPKLQVLVHKANVVSAESSGLTRAIKQDYGEKLYRRFSSMNNIEDIETLPKIDDKMHLRFIELFQKKKVRDELEGKSNHLRRTFSEGLKGPNLISRNDEPPLKKHKADK